MSTEELISEGLNEPTRKKIQEDLLLIMPELRKRPKLRKKIMDFIWEQTELASLNGYDRGFERGVRREQDLMVTDMARKWQG